MSSETVKRLICLIYFRLLCVSVKVWAVEGCRGGLCEVGFATCRTQVPPASSSRATAGHSWSPLPCMWHLWETYLRAKYHMAVWGLRKTVWEPALQTPRTQKKEWEDVFQELEWRFPCSPWRTPWWSWYPRCRLWRARAGTALSWRTAAHGMTG